MHVDLHVRGYISFCVDIDISCQGMLEKKAPLRQLNLEWKGACLLCWQDTGVSHDRWPEQGREDPLRLAAPEHSSQCHRAHSWHSRWFLLSTLTLCDTTLCDRNARRAREPGLSSSTAKGKALVGPAIEHRCAHLPGKGWRALQQHFPMCDMW